MGVFEETHHHIVALIYAIKGKESKCMECKEQSQRFKDSKKVISEGVHMGAVISKIIKMSKKSLDKSFTRIYTFSIRYQIGGSRLYL